MQHYISILYLWLSKLWASPTEFMLEVLTLDKNKLSIRKLALYNDNEILGQYKAFEKRTRDSNEMIFFQSFLYIF